MEKKTFGKTGLKVLPLGFGAMRLPTVDIGGETFVDIERAAAVIRHALDRGVNYIDTGFLYCNRESEIAVGRALKGYRDRVILTTKATKMRLSKKGDLRRMLEHQLRKLDVDNVDFYCFHGIGWQKFHDIDTETGWINDMMKARQEGLVKHIAFSFHDKPENMFKIIDLGFFEMVTCQYNYLNRDNEEAIAYARRKGLGVVVMGPVGGGILAECPDFLGREGGIQVTDAATLALRFVLSNPDVDIALSGMGTKKMVSENLKAVAAGPLASAEYKKLNILLERKRKLAELYCTGCGYCMPCKHGVNIPGRFSAMNYYRVYGLKNHGLKKYAQVRAGEKKNEGSGICVECGECENKCPQRINIIKQLEFAEKTMGPKI